MSFLGRTPAMSVVMAVAFASVTAAASAEDKADKAEIVALYRQLQHAMKDQSSAELMPLLSPEFKYTGRDGKSIDGKTFAAQLETQKQDVKSIDKMEIKVTKIVLKGAGAKVTNSFSWAMTIEDTKGQIGAKGKKHVMAMSGNVTNDLAKTDKGWRFLSLRTVEGNPTMDGKPMVHRAPPPVQKQVK